jgi:hypothetical protein
MFFMNRLNTVKCFIINIFSLFLSCFSSFSQHGIDIKTLISEADLLYTTPVTRSEEGMPVGNGTMGREEAARYLIPNQIRTAEIETMPNRMTLREGYQTTGMQVLNFCAAEIFLFLHHSLIEMSGQWKYCHKVAQSVN